MKKLILSFIFVVSFISAYSQSLDNSLNSASILKKQSKENNLLISAKVGYHTGYDKNSSDGFNGGMIYSLNVDGSLMEETNVGLSFDFWHLTDDEFKTFDGILLPKTYTGTNINFNLTRRFRGENYSINLGIGIGMYFVNRESGSFESSKNSYFNLKLIWSADIRISDVLFISPQVEFNNMFNFEKAPGTFSFKIGPSIILED